MEKEYFVVDFEREGRGGSVYLRRYVKWMEKQGLRVRLIKTYGHGRRALGCCIFLSVRSWFTDLEIISTGPIGLAYFGLARKTSLCIQSPVERWSELSRLLLRYSKRLVSKYICVSRTTKESLERVIGKANTVVEYAKIEASSNYTQIEQRLGSSEVGLMTMDSGLISKGHEEHVKIVNVISEEFSCVVSSYGLQDQKRGSYIGNNAELKNWGYVENPFAHFLGQGQGQKLFYLGLSHFEGMHMAVVEAGGYAIPSIMSDISAHRELSMIAGVELPIAKDLERAIDIINRACRDDEFYKRLCLDSCTLYERFQDVAFQMHEEWET